LATSVKPRDDRKVASETVARPTREGTSEPGRTARPVRAPTKEGETPTKDGGSSNERRSREAHLGFCSESEMEARQGLPRARRKKDSRGSPESLSEPFEMRDRKIPPLPDARRARESRKILSRRRPFKEVSRKTDWAMSQDDATPARVSLERPSSPLDRRKKVHRDPLGDPLSREGRRKKAPTARRCFPRTEAARAVSIPRKEAGLKTLQAPNERSG